MRILFITHRLPYAPNRGDRIRAFHLLREMSKWAEVHLCALVHDDEEASHVDDLRGLVRSVTVARVPRLRNLVRAGLALGSSTPMTHVLLDAPKLAAAVDQLAVTSRPDVVYCYCTGIGPLALRSSLAGIPMVLDMVDVDSIKWSNLAGSRGYPMSWVYSREARCLSRFESTIAMKAAVTLLVTGAERLDFEKIAPCAPAAVVCNGVDREYDLPGAPRQPQDNPTVVFCGVMNYPPNVQGIQWFARDVWPVVRTRLPGAVLKIVGANPSRAVQGLGNRSKGIEVTGTVTDVRPFLWAASVAIAPLMTARGVQTKVLEAIAAGLTAVVTPAVSRGLPAELEGHFRVASTTQDFAEAVIVAATSRHVETPALSRDLSWEAQLRPLRPLLEAAQGRVEVRR